MMLITIHHAHRRWQTVKRDQRAAISAAEQWAHELCGQSVLWRTSKRGGYRGTVLAGGVEIATIRTSRLRNERVSRRIARQMIVSRVLVVGSDVWRVQSILKAAR